MQAVIVLDDCLSASSQPLDLGRRVLDVLSRGPVPTELLRLPFRPAGRQADQLLALGLLPMTAYSAVFVVQTEAQGLDAETIYRVYPGPALPVCPVRAGQAAPRDTAKPLATLVDRGARAKGGAGATAGATTGATK